MIVSIVNHKGGTGKTSTTLNLGAALGQSGLKVCLIDFDAQGSLSYWCGIGEDALSITNALAGEVSLGDVTYPFENVSIIPGGRSLADIELAMAGSQEQRLYHLKQLLLTLNGFDVILIDCPPSLSLLTVNALIASTHAILPMQMDVLALNGLNSMLCTIEQVTSIHPDFRLLGLLPVMIDTRKKVHQEVKHFIRCNYTLPVFKSVIRSNIKLMEAPSFGASIFQYAPSSTAAQDYRGLAKELMSILKRETLTT
jgi:chromosome partitioning protein